MIAIFVSNLQLATEECYEFKNLCESNQSVFVQEYTKGCDNGFSMDEQKIINKENSFWNCYKMEAPVQNELAELKVNITSLVIRFGNLCKYKNFKLSSVFILQGKKNPML